MKRQHASMTPYEIRCFNNMWRCFNYEVIWWSVERTEVLSLQDAPSLNHRMLTIKYRGKILKIVRKPRTDIPIPVSYFFRVPSKFQLKTQSMSSYSLILIPFLAYVPFLNFIRLFLLIINKLIFACKTWSVCTTI